MPDEKDVVLSTTGLTKIFGFGRTRTLAVDNVNINLHRGEVVSIVGESGSGKTTLAKLLLGLINPTEGRFTSRENCATFALRRKSGSIGRISRRFFRIPTVPTIFFKRSIACFLDCIRMRGGRGFPHEKKVELMIEACSFVNLKFEELTNKYPFELSGGQMQRLMIARIFLLKPKILLADEPTSMIDACSRATILDFLMQLRDEVGMTIIFITHDIGLAYFVSDSVYIMERGRFVESGSADDVILRPKETYTQRLINDVPKIHEEWDLSTVQYSS